MIGVWTVWRVKMPHIHHLPGGFARLQENVIQAMTEKHAAPRPVDLVRGAMAVFVDFTEGIQPS